jgi:hypothetical protein
LVRCGELCKSCVGKCRDIVTPQQPAEIECPECGGEGCEHCKDGWFEVTECPTKYIGQELIQDIHVIGATDQHLPVAGGLLDQSAWWFELRGLLKLEEYRVQEEQNKRRSI